MRKMKLNLDALNVESFGTASPVLARGTVQAHQQGPMDTYADSEATACTCDTQGSTMWTLGYDCNSYKFC
jgi:hypothetical protein